MRRILQILGYLPAFLISQAIYPSKERAFLEKNGCSTMDEYIERFGPGKNATTEAIEEFVMETSFKIA